MRPPFSALGVSLVAHLDRIGSAALPPPCSLTLLPRRWPFVAPLFTSLSGAAVAQQPRGQKATWSH